MNKFVAGTVTGVSLTAIFAVGASLVDSTLKKDFAPGDVLTDTVLNTNFSVLETAINDNSNRIDAGGAVSYDYNTYIKAANISQKVFARDFTISNTNTCAVVTWSFVGDLVDGNPVTRMDRDVCTSMESYYFRAVSNEFQLVQADISIDGTGTKTYILTSPLPLLTTTMRIGDSWGGATDIKTGSTGETFVIEKRVLLGVENVTIPVNSTIQDLGMCLKIHVTRSGLKNRTWISWYCPGLGEVKRIQNNTGSEFKDIQLLLTGYTVQ